MAKAELEYDDSAFYYFAIANLFLVLVPWTYYTLKRIVLFYLNRSSTSLLGDEVPAAVTSGRTEQEKKKFDRLLKEKRSIWTLYTRGFVLRSVFLVGFWVLLVYVCALVSSDAEIKTYDPFAILGIEPGANARQMKKAYRQQSLKWHPDKNPGDEEAAAMFMSIRKAYEALTDEVAKRNYELYGNPDGRQALELSIGLPKWLMDKDNHNAILLVYLLFLVVIVPIAVWRYWSWSLKFADNAVLTETLRIFAHPHVLNTETLTKHLPEILAMAAEYRSIKLTMKEAVELDKVNKRIRDRIPKHRQGGNGIMVNYFRSFKSNEATYILLHAYRFLPRSIF